MKKYQVLIESIGRKMVTVYANSKDEAQDAAYDQWDGSTDGYSDNSILSTQELKTYKIQATMTTYLETEIEAADQDQAWETALNMDGSMFKEMPNCGGWDVTAVIENKEVTA